MTVCPTLFLVPPQKKKKPPDTPRVFSNLSLVDEEGLKKEKKKKKGRPFC